MERLLDFSSDDSGENERHRSSCQHIQGEEGAWLTRIEPSAVTLVRGSTSESRVRGGAAAE